MNMSTEDAGIAPPKKVVLKLGAIYQMDTGVVVRFVGVDRRRYIFAILDEGAEAGFIDGPRENLQKFYQRSDLKLIGKRQRYSGRGGH